MTTLKLLISSSLILFLGTMFANFGNYLFHLLMGRMLGPKDYGALTSLISLAYIFAVISTSLSTTVVKFTTRYRAQKDYQKLFLFFGQLTRAFLVLGTIIFVFFLLAQEKIAGFLNLSDSFPVALIGIWMFLSFLGFINDGILRGFFRFGFISLNAVLTTILKLGLAVILVWRGFSVAGALGAIILGSAFTYLFSFYPLKFLWQYKNGIKKVNWKGFLSYCGPVLLANLGLTSLYAADVVLVKHFFPSFEAGLYASLAVMGKIVFFASNMITSVMFVLVSERFERGKNYRLLLLQSFGLVLVVSLTITAIYFLFPGLMVGILYGRSYLAASSFLGWFAVFITFYSLSSLLVNFFLSIKMTGLSLLPFLAAAFQIILIWFFHQSTLQVIQISILTSALLLFLLLLYYCRYEKKD